MKYVLYLYLNFSLLLQMQTKPSKRASKYIQLKEKHDKIKELKKKCRHGEKVIQWYKTEIEEKGNINVCVYF